MESFDKLKIPFYINAKDNRKVRHCFSSKISWKSWKRVFKNKVRYRVKLIKSEYQNKARKVKYYIKERKSELEEIALCNKITYSLISSVCY